MTNEEFIKTEIVYRQSAKDAPKLLGILNEIDRQEWAEEIITGRHFTYGYVAKRLISHIVQCTSYDGFGLRQIIDAIQNSPSISHRLENIYTRTIYQEAFHAIHDIFSLPAAHAGKFQKTAKIFGFAFKYTQLRHWTYPSLQVCLKNRDSYVCIRFTDLTNEEMIEQAKSQMLDMLKQEIDLSIEPYCDEYEFKAFAADHRISIDFPPYMVLSHPDDIVRWMQYADCKYQEYIHDVRQNSAQNSEIASSIQSTITKWLKPPTRAINLYHEHEHEEEHPTNHLKFDAKVRFAYLNPNYNAINADKVSKYVYCIEAFLAGYKQVDLFYGDTLEDLTVFIHDFLSGCLRRAKDRLALYENEDALQFCINPICEILLSDGAGCHVENIVERLRSEHDYATQKFENFGRDQSMRPFEARIRKNELQTKFVLSDNASWEWDALHVDIHLPLSAVNGLAGKPLKTVLDAGETYEEINNLVIRSAKQLKRGVRIELEPKLIALNEIYC